MWFGYLLLTAAVADLPMVEVDTLKGSVHSGPLKQVTSSDIRLEKDGGEITVPIADVLEIRFPPAPAPKPDENAVVVALADGSRLSCTDVTRRGGELTLESARLGTLKVPLASILNIRFGPPESKLLETWNDLIEKGAKTDLLVTRKGEVLDYLNGVIGEIDEKTVKFLIDQDEIAVNRQKVYGLIYKRPAAAESPAVCVAEIEGGDRLQLEKISWDASEWKGTLASGATFPIPADKIRSLDFSLGKVRYLSQMEPREIKYVPYFDFTWKYRRDRNIDGGPIRLANKTYNRGLSIHSRTELRYRLGGEYRSFQAMMGIDQSMGRKGDVQVTISGNGKELLKADVRGADAPRPIDLDVTGIRDLEILVDFGGDLDIADHLDLADAKVLK